ncbi:MAG: PSD1 and planctomycete cytochrome C domain-containing protein [Planctomycetales bacterium]
MKRSFILLVLLALLAGRSVRLVAAEPSPDDLDLFEKRIRPLLVEHCQKCHGANKQEAGLRLDSREAALQGGDSGPALEAGQPETSLLVEAVGYEGDIKMPPKGKLSDEEIADLTSWVQRGAPWPAGSPSGTPAGKEFNLNERKAAQWAFQPIRAQSPPSINDEAWPLNPVDRFILARLEEAGLKPARPAEKRTLLRRVTFDLTGLPPTAAELAAFLADESPRAYEAVVERLLDSPHYGERWARHWLDLVRYAETSGHEFDFEIPHATEYRDYVVRAFNQDLPYDQFVIEHLAGDLLPQPRRHPVERFNESIIGTGFWFLGESKHSPVDVRADEAERFDNQIDVFGKAFLGQTLGCARCHDHKFDALSTKDYYALSGYLQSSRRQIACVDPPEERRQIVQELERLRDRRRELLRRATPAESSDLRDRLEDYLAAALSVLRPAESRGNIPGDTQPSPDHAVIFEDFEQPTYGRWTVSGRAFGEVPNRRPLPDYQGEVGALGQGFVNSHSALDRQGKRDATDELTGTLTSESFLIKLPYIHFLIGGGAHAGKTCLNLHVEGKVVRTATGRDDNRMDWNSFDVRSLAGKRAHFEIVDQETGGWGNIGVDQITFSRSPVAGPLADRILASAREHKLKVDRLAAWTRYLRDFARSDPQDPLHLLALWGARPGSPSREDFARFRQEQRGQSQARQEASSRSTLFEDFSGEDFGEWFVNGEAFGSAPTSTRPLAGAPLEESTSEPGHRLAHSGHLSLRLEGVLRSRTFSIDRPFIHYRAAGRGTAIHLIVDSLQYLQNPIYGGLKLPLDKPDSFQWKTQEVGKWIGHNAYIELMDTGDGFLAIDRIVFSDSAEPPAEPPNPVSALLIQDDRIDSAERLARGFEALLKGSSKSGGNPRQPPADPLQAQAARSVAQWLSNARLLEPRLPGEALSTESPTDSRVASALAELTAQFQKLEAQIHYRRKVIAICDGTGEDDRVHLRGSPHRFGDVVPRRFLEAVAGVDQPPPAAGSGRLELARRVVDPTNPLLPRVIVNRLWKLHMGEGLVRTPDDFGNMGQPPTHPELLDYLATQLTAPADQRGNSWSLKRLQRLLLLSRTYQMSSQPLDELSQERDPQNKLWHRMNLRRLEAEAIRDAILAISGRLNAAPVGGSVLPHLTPFMVGRGRPANSGPLDGDGRRSLYISVRRNFLTPMFLAFDYPVPFSTIGRRSVSNVPAQALALMNNPFVVEQAEVWGRRVAAESSDNASRLREMYVAAYSREPTETELAEALEFLATQSRQSPDDPVRPWADLAHVLFNVKEFVFVE